ncbi:CHAT domain-containing protein [Dactylosporangium cerinum]
MDTYPIALACIDADGTLSVAAQAEGAYEVTLRNSKRVDRTSQPASRENFLRALAATAPAAPKIAFFTGHSDAGVAGVDAALRLEDGLLTAEDLTFGAGLAFPARVVFSSCSSGGAVGAGRGEWLGLSAACLLRGARQVIGTAWPILDHPATLAFEEDLLDALVAGVDPASALRACQLRRLAEWRVSDFDLTEGARLMLPSDLATPLVWASFQCMGVY